MAMKIVLLKDVMKVGRKTDVKEVSDGYALNFLIPRGLAETATQKVLARVEKEKAREAADKKVRQDLLLKNFGDLKGVVVAMEKVSNKEGHLFAGIHQEEIAAAIKEQTRLDVLPELIVLKEPLKKVGEHEIEVKIGERAVKFTLNVKPLEEESSKRQTKKSKKAS